MKLHILQHERFEAPGAIDEWALRQKHEVRFTRLYEGAELPHSTDNLDLLVVMGGPQCPGTTQEECPYFDAKKEIEFIRRTIRDGKKVLGICLGAQLVGEALGARFEHSPNKEIGVFELSLTPAARDDPLFSMFPKTFLAGHWHGDMPGLTPESQVLARSEGCPRQIVKYSPKVYGFQCHFEFTHDTLEGMIQHCGHELRENADLPYVQSEDALRKQDYRPINNLLFRFLDYISRM